VHEAAWQSMQDKPWLWCKLVWCMFDFGSAGRNEGDTPGINDKGMVTADRSIKKDVYFYYQSNWTTEPMVHITDGRFNPRPVGAADVKVYSNCDSVELWVNGKSLGSKTSAAHIFIWPAIDLADGKTDARAVGSIGGKSVTDSISWTVSAAVKEADHSTPPRAGGR
jgi:beta-galactosidase